MPPALTGEKRGNDQERYREQLLWQGYLLHLRWPKSELRNTAPARTCDTEHFSAR